MQVVVQQPRYRGIPVAGIIGVGQGLGIFADQVVEAVAIGAELGDQVMVVEILRVAADQVWAGVVQCPSDIGIDVGDRMQTQSAEQSLLSRESGRGRTG